MASVYSLILSINAYKQRRLLYGPYISIFYLQLFENSDNTWHGTNSHIKQFLNTTILITNYRPVSVAFKVPSSVQRMLEFYPYI